VILWLDDWKKNSFEAQRIHTEPVQKCNQKKLTRRIYLFTDSMNFARMTDSMCDSASVSR
jgi:hypothetical protein